MKFADPKNDLAFKKIFGNEKKTEILISLINSILGFTGDNRVVSVTIVNPYQVPKIEELKSTILDVKAVNQRGEHFIVEMQKKDLNNFAKRSLYYTSKAYVNQLDSGMKYSNLQKVYFIGILEFEMFQGDNYITRHLILNRETLKQEIADFEFSFIELDKFKKELSECKSVLDKWIYFIKNAESLTMIPKEYEDTKEFLEAFEIAEQTRWNKEEMEIYDYISLKEEDDRNAIRTAEKKGLKRGIKQGLKQGIEQGIEQERAKQEKIQKEKTVKSLKNLLDAGISMEIACNSLGISIDEAKKLL